MQACNTVYGNIIFLVLKAREVVPQVLLNISQTFWPATSVGHIAGIECVQNI